MLSAYCHDKWREDKATLWALAAETAWLIKMLTAKTDYLSLTPEPAWWKERTDFLQVVL